MPKKPEHYEPMLSLYATGFEESVVRIAKSKAETNKKTAKHPE
jgi:hypothetical protein